MRFQLNKIIAAAAIALSCSSIHASALDDADKDEVRQIVRQYLLENPEILIEMQDVLEARVAVAEQERAKQAIASMSDDIYNGASDTIIGNPDADVTIVEFFDYNCGYCKRAMQDMQDVLATDSNVKFILKEFPILGPESVQATRVSIAVGRIAPELSGEFHMALLSRNGRANEESAISVATDLGIDEDVLMKELEDENILADLEATSNLTSALNITGTPSYLIGDQSIGGAVGAGELLTIIDNMRECGAAEC